MTFGAIRRVLNDFEQDRKDGGNFWDTLNRKFCHTFFSHRYELRAIRKYWKTGKVLNIGAGRDAGKLGKNVISLDFRNGEDDYTRSHRWQTVRPTVVADMHFLPFREDTFDTVMSMHVLEHARDPFQAMMEFFRVTKTGGHIANILPCAAGNPWWNYIRDQTHIFAWTRHDFLLWISRFVHPKNIYAGQVPYTGMVVQYCRMKKWLNRWSFDCVIRKN